MEEEANRTLWNPIINAGNERRDKRKRDAGRARHRKNCRLLMQHMDNYGERRWAAKTQAALDVWLGWRTALLQLDDSGRYLSSRVNIGGRPLLTEKSAERPTGHKDFVVGGRQSPVYFFFATDVFSAYLSVSQGLRSYVDSNWMLKKLVLMAFLMEVVENSPLSVFMGHRRVQLGGSEWPGSYPVRCLIFENEDLPEVIAFA